MAQARTIAPATATARVRVIAPEPLAATAIAALRVRGIAARAPEPGRASEPRPDDTDDVIAWALDTVPTAAAAVDIAAACERAAAAGRPVCLLAPVPRGAGRVIVERAAALAYLRAHGAALARDVDAWLEAVVLLVRFGLPTGPRAAVIAPPGSWLEAQVLVVAADAEAAGGRSPVAGPDEPTDVVLYDCLDLALGAPPRTMPGLHVPVAARGELAGETAALYGVRPALDAIAILGGAVERIAVGLGPAPPSASAELAIDEARLRRQLDKTLVFSELVTERRLGDHETKSLLATYGVPITRQAVATTPSAAVKIARQVGYPVEIKPWGHDLPTELAGCPVERGVTSDAAVRQAFHAVLIAAGKSTTKDTAVIVREPPPQGRHLAVSLLRLPSLGWTVVLDTPGSGQIAAAPAPLRLIDAQALAAQVVASRAGELEPDRSELANLLRRASHLVVDLDHRLASLELRVVIGGRAARTLVVDAYAELR